MKDLKGKVAIITGAGMKNGMGRATALKLAEYGVKVVVTDICKKRPELEMKEGGHGVGDDLSVLEELVGEIEVLGSEGLALAVDVTDKNQIATCVNKCIETFGNVDILFNNAGVGIGSGDFLEISDEKWDLTWKVNVKGMVDFCKAVIPIMIKNDGGVIINQSSLMGIGALPYFSGYVTSKFASIGLSKAIAAEFGDRKIRCNAICPGMIKTDMGVAEINLISKEHGISLEEAEKLAVDPVAIKRWATPEEVADVVAFLASDMSAYLSGVALPIAGGLPSGL